MGTSPPKKRRRHHYSTSAKSPPHLPIPLESGLEDNPDPHPGLEDNPDPHPGLEEPSVDSSESDVSLSDESDKEPTAEPGPQPSKTLDTSLNFRLGYSSTQVMAQYSTKAPSPPAVESSLMISRHLALWLAQSEVAAVAELQALMGPEPPVAPPTPSQPMALEYTPAQLESSRTNLEVWTTVSGWSVCRLPFPYR